MPKQRGLYNPRYRVRGKRVILSRMNRAHFFRDKGGEVVLGGLKRGGIAIRRYLLSPLAVLRFRPSRLRRPVVLRNTAALNDRLFNMAVFF